MLCVVSPLAGLLFSVAVHDLTRIRGMVAGLLVSFVTVQPALLLLGVSLWKRATLGALLSFAAILLSMVVLWVFRLWDGLVFM